MVCSKCGAMLPDGSAFCTVCGAKQGVSAETVNVNNTKIEDETKTVAIEQPAMPQGQTAPVYGQQVNPAQSAPNGMPQQGMPQNGMPYGQPMPGQQGFVPQQGMPQNGMPQNGMPMNGMPQNGMYGQQPGMYAMPNQPKAPRKPFVMPAIVNVILGILAVAAVAVFVAVLILGRPEVKESGAVNPIVVEAGTSYYDLESVTTFDISGYTFDLEVPETEEAQRAATLFVIADSDSRYLEESELADLTEAELVEAYYEIWARAGLDFSTIEDAETMYDYFLEKPWYNPWFSWENVNLENPYQLNEYEIANMQLIDAYLAATYGDATSDENTEEVMDELDGEEE